MVQVNENYLKLKAGYLFPEISKRVKTYSQSNKSAEIIKLGIGDVTEPLPRACIEAMGKALAIASLQALGNGSVTSPIPSLIISELLFDSEYVFTLLAISGNK